VSTPDLLTDVPRAVWLPNPVDVEHFTPINHPVPNTALYTMNWYDATAYTRLGVLASLIATRLQLQLTVVHRYEGWWIPHTAFPAYLGQFEYLIDRFALPSLSKTALEALALGVKVIDWRGTIHDGLPPEHAPEQVAQHSIHIYEELS
jgi:hypothetical protein